MASSEVSESIHIVVRATLRDTEEQLRDFAAVLCDSIKESEPGTLIYGWSVAVSEGDDPPVCYVEERYADNAAFVRHMAGLRDSGSMRRLVKLLRVSEVLLLEGDADLVGRELAPLVPVAFRSIATI